MNKKRAIIIAVVVFIFGAAIIEGCVRGKSKIEVSGDPDIMKLVEKNGTASPQDLAEIRRVALHTLRQANFDSFRQSKGKNLGRHLKFYLFPGVCSIYYETDRDVMVGFGKMSTNEGVFRFMYETKGTNGWYHHWPFHD